VDSTRGPNGEIAVEQHGPARLVTLLDDAPASETAPFDEAAFRANLDGSLDRKSK
jgi:hypothetical protein